MESTALPYNTGTIISTGLHYCRLNLCKEHSSLTSSWYLWRLWEEDEPHREDWIILLAEQRLLSPLNVGLWQMVILHRLIWLLSLSIFHSLYLHVSLLLQTAKRSNSTEEEQTSNEISATISPSLSFHSPSLFVLLCFLVCKGSLGIFIGSCLTGNDTNFKGHVQSFNDKTKIKPMFLKVLRS